MRSYLTPCINDCGTYGQCKLLRTNNYLYAACECKAGEKNPLELIAIMSSSHRKLLLFVILNLCTCECEVHIRFSTLFSNYNHVH